MSYNNTTHAEIFQYGYSTHAPYHYISSDGSPLNGDDSNFWSSSPSRSDSPSPTTDNMQSVLVNSYPYFTTSSPSSFSRVLPPEQRHLHCVKNYPQTAGLTDDTATTRTTQHVHVPFVRVVKRRSTANKKERRRTQSINNAYADLRDCIPNVPPDTKLSKIKTLRLATSYINYLVKALESDDPAGSFTAELGSISSSSSNCSNSSRRSNLHGNERQGEISPKSDASEDINKTRKAKGRTGWPQHVWALELEQDQAL